MPLVIVSPYKTIFDPEVYNTAVLLDTPTYFLKMDDAAVPLADTQGCMNFNTQVGGFNFQQPGKNNYAIQSVASGAYIWAAVGACASSGGIDSMEALVKRSVPPTGADEYIGAIDRNFAIGAQTGTGFLQCRFVRQSTGTYEFLTTTMNICDGAWHHVVVTVNGPAWEFYVDNVNQSLVGSDSMGFGFFLSNIVFSAWDTMAPWTPPAGSTWDDSISSVAYWRSTVLTPVQVSNHYTAYLALP